MKKITKIRIITYIVLGVFIAALLIGLGIKSNLSTNEARYWKGTQSVVCVNVSRIEREDAPLGVSLRNTALREPCVPLLCSSRQGCGVA